MRLESRSFRRVGLACLVGLAASVGPPRAEAQAVQDRFDGAVLSTPGPSALTGARTGVPVLAGSGLLGGVVGGTAGAFVGAWLGSGRCAPGDDCFAETVSGASIGLALGEGLGLAFGVHLANGRAGSFGLSAAATTAIAFGGLGLLHLTGFDAPAGPLISLAVPVAQVAAAILIERGR